MKLSDFVEEHILCTGMISINERAKEKFTVISTCPSCLHYEKWEPIDMCNSPHNQGFGCIYWSEKK